MIDKPSIYPEKHPKLRDRLNNEFRVSWNARNNENDRVFSPFFPPLSITLIIRQSKGSLRSRLFERDPTPHFSSSIQFLSSSPENLSEEGCVRFLKSVHLGPKCPLMDLFPQVKKRRERIAFIGKLLRIDFHYHHL